MISNSTPRSGTAPRSGSEARSLEPGPALEVRELSRIYGSGEIAVQALRAVSFTVRPGDVVCIMGKSGSGKSTLLRQLGLIDEPTSGTILIDGEDVTRLPERRRSELRLAKLGYVFQEYALLAELTAEENVLLPALMHGRSEAEGRRRAGQLLAMLDLGDRRSHRPSQLSGGEQQRVAIARALVNDPTMLLADEPTGNLDSRATATVMQALVRINQELGVTILFVSHDSDHRRYATKLIYLRDGALVAPY